MNKFPIEPLFDRVFVKKDEEKVSSTSGFALPETVKGRSEFGVVVAVGPGYFDPNTGKFLPTQLKVGDRVFIKGFDGYSLRYKDYDEVFVFNESEILGKVTDEE